MSNELSFEKLEELRTEILQSRPSDKRCVSVCSGPGCHAQQCHEVADAFREELKKRGLQDSIDLKTTGCHGFCERGPIAVIHPQGIFYQRLKPGDAEEIVAETLLENRIVERLLYTEPKKESIVQEQEIPFYKLQDRVILDKNNLINPLDIRDYIALGGYQSISKVLREMTPEQVIAEVKSSGLRGRGGAGFPTGVKWEGSRNFPADKKYIVCNADEGDPGAYMDRSVLEGNPHSVIEGMLIGAYAMGASEGYVYVRSEYPIAVKNVKIALQQAEEYGLVGKSILGTEFGFDFHVFQGAGAFVCGEETSLMASIEGRRAFPKTRPPFPVHSGLWGKPTSINNVETWANVAHIVAKGAKWYSSIGTETSKGTKIFSLVGKIKNTGLVEVPMGTTLRRIIFDIGGGIKGGKKFKAVQTGGPSGGCLPEAMLDLPIDYESLARAGSIMGSGGMIVMDEDTCMVELARYFLNFTQEESCGKCVPCRIGTQQMVNILTRITEGEGREGDIERLEQLARTVKAQALCGLGQTAPNPVVTTLRYFRHEYEAHISQKICPASVCKSLVQFRILPEKCTGCGTCARVCPTGAATGSKKEVHNLDITKCVKCRACYEGCRFGAIIAEPVHAHSRGKVANA
jgi:NADH:ubiquinone oxidoreductase subunit F (NADH-binding)/(2Fe-2S) ferredoxin/NAD-dependent dihydropyrimidine dehydrogenase PreA subunit